MDLDSESCQLFEYLSHITTILYTFVALNLANISNQANIAAYFCYPSLRKCSLSLGRRCGILILLTPRQVSALNCVLALQSTLVSS
jgi:hypothetical protein